MKSIFIILSLLSSLVLAAEPTHLITLKGPTERSTSLEVCLDQINNLNMMQPHYEFVNPVSIVSTFGGDLIILGVSLNQTGVQQAKVLECVLAIELNGEVGPNPSIGKSN